MKLLTLLSFVAVALCFPADPAGPAPAGPAGPPAGGPGAPPAAAGKPRPFGTFAKNPIFQPSSNEGVSYPRQTQLSDGTLLATSAFHVPTGLPFFPIFASTDGGATWTWRSNMTDQVNGLGFSAQPALYQLPFDAGKFKAGTVLASGNSWGSKSTNIDLYASSDSGKTWEFVTNVARGGPPSTQDGVPAIWEPFILAFNGTVGVFYSDQRDPAHSQKLSHQESTDLVNWSAPIDDIAYLNQTARPGMTVIAEHPPTGLWFFVHEFPGGDGFWDGVGYPVYVHTAISPFDFRFSYGVPLVADGIQPNASPYIVWSPQGGVNGTLIVSDADHSGVFINTASGRADAWQYKATPQPQAYSRSLHIMQDNPDHLMILGAAVYADTTNPPLSLSVISIKDTLLGPSPPAGPGH